MTTSGRKNELLYRVYAVMIAFCLFAIVISYRVVTISVIEGEEWRSKVETTHMGWYPLPTQRGDIYADDGQSLLATSVEFFEIRMDPTVIKESVFRKEIDGLCAGLEKYNPNKSASDWKKMIVNGRNKQMKYLPIAKKVDHFGLEELSSLPLFKYGPYNGGLIKIRRYQREKTPPIMR